MKKNAGPQQARGRITVPAERVAHIFAIGDIHGRLDLLLAAEERIFERMRHTNNTPAIVVCVGDFIDRGPDSRGVIDHLIKKMPRPFYRICLCGNHDSAFFDFLMEDQFDPTWLGFGGDKTLRSYGVNIDELMKRDPSGMHLKEIVRSTIPASHFDFFDELPVALSIGRYVFVHAGLQPGLPLAEQSDHDLLWIREPFLSTGPQLDVTVVHGHTPVNAIQYGTNRIGIDTGAYATGKLSILHIGPDGIDEV